MTCQSKTRNGYPEFAYGKYLFIWTSFSDGKNGTDGVTPHIGENGNWWLGETDTGVKATAEADLSWDIPTVAFIGVLALAGNVAWILLFFTQKKNRMQH